MELGEIRPNTLARLSAASLFFAPVGEVAAQETRGFDDRALSGVYAFYTSQTGEEALLVVEFDGEGRIVAGRGRIISTDAPAGAATVTGETYRIRADGTGLIDLRYEVSGEPIVVDVEISFDVLITRASARGRAGELRAVAAIRGDGEQSEEPVELVTGFLSRLPSRVVQPLPE